MRNKMPIVRYLSEADFNKRFIQIKRAVELEHKSGVKFYKPLHQLNCGNTKDIGDSFITSNLIKLDSMEIEYTGDFLFVKDVSDIQRIKLKSFCKK